LKEALNVFNRSEKKTAEDRTGGLHGEASLVMKNGDVHQGLPGSLPEKDGDEYKTKENLPPIPPGKSVSDVEATIHDHIAGILRVGDKFYSGDATLKSAADEQAFPQFQMNVIVGPDGPPTGKNDKDFGVIPFNRQNIMLVFKGGASEPAVNVTLDTVKSILKQ
jgi:hypothetical protein